MSFRSVLWFACAYNEAKSNFEKSIKIRESLGLRQELSHSYVSYRKTPKPKGEPKKAREYQSKANSLFKGCRAKLHLEDGGATMP